MAAIPSLDTLVNLLSGGNSGTPVNLFWWKDTSVDGATAASPVFSFWTSLWRYGGQPSAGAAPSTAMACDNTLAGCLKQASPGGSRHQFVVGASVTSVQSGTFLFYDRLAQVGGLSGTTTTAQTITGATPTRYTSATNGAVDSCFGNHIFVEISTQIGTTAVGATISYEDQNGSTRVTPEFVIGGTGLREAQRLIHIPTLPGFGITDLVNLDLVATTGTAGDIAIVIARPLFAIPHLAAGTPALQDYAMNDPGIARLFPGACLSVAYLASGTSVPQVLGQIQIVES